MTTATRSNSGAHAPVTKIYRMALYGRKSSGKTCILAALAWRYWPTSWRVIGR